MSCGRTLRPLPLVGLDALKAQYPRFARFLDRPDVRDELGIGGDGPWPVVLAGYILNGLARPEREIRTTPYLARPGDEYFPARRPGTQAGDPGSRPEPPARALPIGRNTPNRWRSDPSSSVETCRIPMTLIKDLIEIPDHVEKGQFVLRLAEGVTRPEETLRDYVVTPELRACYEDALSFIKSGLADKDEQGELPARQLRQR